MGNFDRERTARAAVHVSHRSNSVTMEVIEKDEDVGLTLPARLSASLAAFFVCGGSYFAIWLMVEIKTGDTFPDLQPAIWLWILTWRLPFLATALTTLAAFLSPGWAYRWFGKFTRSFDRLW